MRLKINHTSVYTYDEPVQYSLQRLRLTPKTQPGQTVLDWRTTVHGAHVEVGYADHFGNHVDLVSMNADQTTIRIVAEGEVETEDRSGVFGPHQGFVPLWLYLRDTPLTKPGRLVRELARTAEGETELARMHALMATLHQAVDYKAGETATDTTAERALEKGSGVCQDHAHIFCAVCRTLGIPARYVSGYLFHEAHASSHAWADAFVEHLGWVSFDPSNRTGATESYIRIATGLDYAEAGPIRGVRSGGGVETMTYSVMFPSQQQQVQ